MVFVGFMKAYNLLNSIFWGVIRNFIRGVPKNLKQRYGENSWAVVTGATSGIGLAYCEILAK